MGFRLTQLDNIRTNLLELRYQTSIYQNRMSLKGLLMNNINVWQFAGHAVCGIYKISQLLAI